ncbi:hypothetical protein P691DRAFT_683240 [Macrolepiota fuliginosa MF-IS2]|uniref:P-loop containing nucleoside triphosphate hydrolase protein n=1 Tax=Macrolepiota fuliginosa MF-IS2 TaxID=1400762 RepID=A0A9P6BW94_9AGAR|nr:hypothetical protein P691DRAFT_683240 [Macrolepiota fuliginosa MF-IS2]
MPSHTAASALIRLFFFNGAPWEWSVWQELTGIRHGLFPSEDKKLPPGWTRKDASDVWSYFLAYNNLDTEEQKIRFATRTKGNSSYPGRVIWNSFVSRNWSRWGVNTLVVEELRAWDVHPVSILVRENINSSWPCADFYIPMILDTLGMKLFGEEAFPSGSEVLPTDLRRCLQNLAQRSWSTIRLQVSVLRNRSTEIEAAAVAAFEDLDQGKPTKAKVNRAIRAVAKWKECAELLHTAENIKKAEDMLAEIQVIMEGLGAKVVKPKVPKAKSEIHLRICKVSTAALKDLATEEDVTDLLSVYHEYFEAHVEDEDEPPITDELPEKKELNNSGGDFGMEAEQKLSFSSLSCKLGFRNGLPAQFNLFRHRSGISPWDDEKAFKFAGPVPVELLPIRFYWHQLAAIHSITRSVFTEEKDGNHTMGVLIGDEVGLGKTAQAIGMLAFMNQLIFLQRRELQLPPIIRDRPYLAGSTKIPSLPHLIVCPGTLLAQWVSELKVLFLPKSVDILVYDSQADSATFWGPDGPLHTSNHDLHNCIIVSSHSALFTDMQKTHKKPDRKNVRPWTIPDAKSSLVNTIFSQDFLTITVDEAHHMRNAGNKHTAALRLLQQTRVRLIMTATPLHTAPKDIASVARLVGIPHFFTEETFIEEKSDAARFRRAKKLDDDGESALAEQVQIVKRLQDHCEGHFLRRTARSHDVDGQVLLELPPYIEIVGTLVLTERETSIMKERSEFAKATVLSSTDSTKIQTKKFYLEYRTAVGYAKEDPADPWPLFKSLEEWEPVKSTKMDVCARVCKHYLTHDDMEDVTFVDGVPVFPESAATGKEIRRNRRVIIYAEFSSMAPLLQNVLSLYGIPSLAINGKISFSQRDKRIKELYGDSNPARVLIFSSVGSAGLNLSIADVVIFFDQPWSAQDERQIRGRAHRQPQKKVVKVIYLLASDSADLLMNHVARGKRNMFDAFVNKDLGEGSIYSSAVFLSDDISYRVADVAAGIYS